MTSLILVTLVGLIFAFLATQNNQLVDLNVNGYMLTIPIYMVALGSLLIGFLISSIVSIIDSISAFFTIHDKDHKIKANEKTVGDLESRIHTLELENAELKGEKREYHPTVADKIKRNLATK